MPHANAASLTEEAICTTTNETWALQKRSFGLTLLICGLVAIGYIILLRLGTTSEATVEVRPGISAPPLAHTDPSPPDDEPRVLPIETEVTAQRPGATPSPNSPITPPPLQRR